MASRPKLKFTTLCEQNVLLEATYNELDEGEESFLGNRFIDEDALDDDYEVESGSDNSEAENEADVTEVEQEIEQVEEEGINMENIVKEKKSNESENPATIQRKQKFKTLDYVVNENNYNNAPARAERSFEYTDSKEKVWKWNGKQIKTKKSIKEQLRIGNRNKPGPRRAAKSVKNPSSTFKDFFTDKMIDNIVQYTNKSMQPATDKFSDLLDGSTKYSHVKIFARVDIEAFIGILHLRAAFRLNILDREVIWNQESAHHIIAATMLLHRFKFICHLITFDDKETRNNRWKTDQFACMREPFEDINEKNTRMRHSSPLLEVDETLYSYRGHIGFRQYNPNKSAKYGLLYQSLCYSSIPYTYYSLPYAGKPEKVEGPAVKYYITGTDEYSKYLINELYVYCNFQGINISMDRYFPSVSLATWALQKNITAVGAMKHDRKGIPVVDREEKSVMHAYNTKEKIRFHLVSYIDKKKSGKNNDNHGHDICIDNHA